MANFNNPPTTDTPWQHNYVTNESLSYPPPEPYTLETASYVTGTSSCIGASVSHPPLFNNVASSYNLQGDYIPNVISSVNVDEERCFQTNETSFGNELLQNNANNFVGKPTPLCQNETVRYYPQCSLSSSILPREVTGNDVNMCSQTQRGNCMVDNVHINADESTEFLKILDRFLYSDTTTMVPTPSFTNLCTDHKCVMSELHNSLQPIPVQNVICNIQRDTSCDSSHYVPTCKPGHYSENDVLLGRGGHCARHCGNQLFLHLRDKLYEQYKNAKTNKAKKQIQHQLIQAVYEMKGRFMQKKKRKVQIKHNKIGSIQKGVDYWVVVTDTKRIYQKASQALREGRA